MRILCNNLIPKVELYNYLVNKSWHRSSGRFLLPCLEFMDFFENSSWAKCRSNFNKKTLAQVFSCEFYEISKNNFFTEHLWATAFLNTSIIVRWYNTFFDLMDYLTFFCVLSMTTLFVNFTKDLTHIVILAFTKVRKKDTLSVCQTFRINPSRQNVENVHIARF